MTDSIHIISAGESIHKTYPVAIKKELKDITRSYVIVEKGIFVDSLDDDEKKRAAKIAIQAAIEKVERISKEMDISFHQIIIDTITIENVRDAVLDIYNEYPDAQYSFNISGGTKILSIGLFMMSIWIGGDSYHTPGGEIIQKLNIPKMHVKDISTNQNYVQILNLLEPYGDSGMLRKDLSREMEKTYSPVRNSGEKSTRKLTGGVLSKLTESLNKWKLVEEFPRPKSKKEKMFRITADGLLALKFIRIQNKKSKIQK
jgi:hypothetical protein